MNDGRLIEVLIDTHKRDAEILKEQSSHRLCHVFPPHLLKASFQLFYDTKTRIPYSRYILKQGKKKKPKIPNFLAMCDFRKKR